MQPASATQTELDFEAPSAPGAGDSGAYPSDEEILGMDDAPHGREAATPAAGSENGADVAAGFSPPAIEGSGAAVVRVRGAGEGQAPGAPPQSGALKGAATPDSEGRATPPEWLQPLLADPKIAPEAHQLWAHAQQLQAIDAAYFSGEPRAQQELAGWLLRDNPAAFRAMLQQGARALAERDPAAFAEFAHAFAGFGPGFGGTATATVIPSTAEGGTRNLSSGMLESQRVDAQRDSSVAPTASGPPRNDDAGNGAARGAMGAGRAQGPAPTEWQQLERQRGELRAEQFAAFQQSANDTVVEQVRGTIEQTLASVLPAQQSGVSASARQRLAEAIFHEINTTLQRDSALTEQVAAIARQWRFDDATRQQVVELIARRARQMVAPVAKRVVGEWTAGIVGAQRTRSERIEQAAARVELAGGGAPETVSRRALAPRDVNYSALTDEQILSL